MRIRIHPLFVFYWAFTAALASWQACLCAFAALAVHETSHYMVSRWTGDSIACIELTPFGGVMTYEKTPHKGLRGLAVAAAGPLGNYAMIALLTLPAVRSALGPEWIRQLAGANLVMLCVNLLPALPLDGGRMLLNVGYYFLPVAMLITVLTVMGMLVGAVLMGWAIYGLHAWGRLNCSLLIAGAYLVLCAARSRGVMLAENLYAVMQERSCDRPSIRRLQLYCVDADTALYTLLDPIARTQACAFVYTDERGTHFVDEKQLCLAMMRRPTGTISNEIRQMRE